MEAKWEEVSRAIIPPPGPQLMPSPATTIAFDNVQELLWVGNEYGRVSSFFGSKLEKYTSFRAHAATGGPVKQLLFNERGVITLGAGGIHFSLRRGISQWNIRHEKMTDLSCMSYTSRGTSEILVAGAQDKMFTVDVDRGQVVKEIETTERYTIMKRSRFICAATASGGIDILDPNTLKVVKTWKAHAAGISDMDAQNNFLVTCGYSPRQQQNYMLDPLANVFDIRMLQPLPPIPFHAGAAFVRMHPKMSTTSIVASQNGQIQVVDLMNPNTVNLRQANISSYMSGLEIAPSGNAIAVADADCSIHLWGSPDNIKFTEVATPSEWADVPMQEPTIDWTPETPFSVIGMPHYREPLLSAWPSHILHECRRPPQRVDPQVAASLIEQDFGAYAPNPRLHKRNQIHDTRMLSGKNVSVAAPKFLSEKAREGVKSKSVTAEQKDSSGDGSKTTQYQVPASYKSVEIRYSRFGVDDFDFEFYNKTKFSGLETHIENCHCNALLQLFRSISALRSIALHHTATNCVFETCLLCEMGFLFDMLERAGGLNCHASNFLRVLSNNPSAQQMQLLEKSVEKKPLPAMVEDMNRFLLERVCTEFKYTRPQSTAVEETIGMPTVTSLRCVKCNTELGRNELSLVTTLQYGTKHPGKGQAQRQRPTFSQVLRSSIEREAPIKGWCPSCRRYLTMTTKRHIQTLPQVLMLNASADSKEARLAWSNPRWLPEKIGLALDRGQLLCFEGAELDRRIQSGQELKLLTLVGSVVDIFDPEEQSTHLVSLINGTALSPSAANDWYLFNDFLVKSVPKDEALDFSPNWKIPCVLAYQASSLLPLDDQTWKKSLDTSLLYELGNLQATVRPLSLQKETPKAGTKIAIDAEFVLLNEEEIDIKADGSRETVRPSRMALARVSVLRGSGLQEGSPFIDDYIYRTENVIDYLTTYSGIHPGDLDKGRSRYQLTSLKMAYKKLWILLNLGCVFVGHGLPKDFRIINIHVPKEQVIDTVDLFFIKSRQRKLSLRFLAWYLLKEDIQTKEHDSIEDARTAMKLYRKAEEFEDAGIMEMMLNDIYAKGREVNFKAPGVQPVPVAAVGAIP